MPWQTAPSLIIIGGAFNVAAGLMYGAQRLGFGEVRSNDIGQRFRLLYEALKGGATGLSRAFLPYVD
jgi:hypothetical protein